MWIKFRTDLEIIEHESEAPGRQPRPHILSHDTRSLDRISRAKTFNFGMFGGVINRWYFHFLLRLQKARERIECANAFWVVLESQNGTITMIGTSWKDFVGASVDEYDSASRHGPIPDLLPYLKVLTALGCSYPSLSDAGRAWQGVFNTKGIYRTCN